MQNENLIDIDEHLANLQKLMVPIDAAFEFLVFEPMRTVMYEMLKLAKIDCPILLLGQTGVGKSYFAKKMHDYSERSKKSFVDLNAATIPEPLFESLFFGHTQGSFTDAKMAHTGYLEQANEGTLFIDEIGDLPLTLQSKLLKILDQNEYQPLGSSKSKAINVRFVFATNVDLEARVAEGLFREDLFYRIACMPVVIPSLKERKTEAIYLFLNFFKFFSSQYQKNVTKLTKGALALIEEFDWPGNIRQIRYCSQRCAIMCTGSVLSQNEISLPRALTTKPTNTLDNLIALSVPQAVQEVEKLVISAKLKRNKSLSDAAKECELSRQTLRSKCKAYNIKP